MPETTSRFILKDGKVCIEVEIDGGPYYKGPAFQPYHPSPREAFLHRHLQSPSFRERIENQRQTIVQLHKQLDEEREIVRRLEAKALNQLQANKPVDVRVVPVKADGTGPVSFIFQRGDKIVHFTVFGSFGQLRASRPCSGSTYFAATAEDVQRELQKVLA
jgi:hypothetical protein